MYVVNWYKVKHDTKKPILNTLPGLFKMSSQTNSNQVSIDEGQLPKYTHMHVNMSVYTYNRCVYTRIRVCVHIYTHIRIYIFTHTYINVVRQQVFFYTNFSEFKMQFIEDELFF